jgi:hypothetical protein
MPVEPPSGEPPPDSGRNVDGTFKAGHKKTGGRKLGTRSKATLMLEALLAKNMKKIGDVLIREAKAGQHWAVKFAIASQLPPARERPIPFDKLKLDTAADVPSAIRQVLDMMADGTLTIGEGTQIIASLEGYARSTVFDGHEARLQALEAMLGTKQDADEGGAT